MRPGRWLGNLIVAACLGMPVAAHAQLTEAEKQLLMSGMSASSATEFGKAGDAAALESIVAICDPALVQAFDYGMRGVRAFDTMPPAIEAVVVKHFDDESPMRSARPRSRCRRKAGAHRR